MSSVFDVGLNEELGLGDIEPAFGKENYISTREWKFTQTIMHVNDINIRTLSNMKMKYLEALEPDKSKGQILWVYVPSGYYLNKLSAIQMLLKAEKFDSLPIAFFILDDKENRFSEAVLDYRISQSFNAQETEKYRRFITDYQFKAQSVLEDVYRDLASERLLLTSDSFEKINQRLIAFTQQIFEKLYTRVIPFPYTEFSNNTLTKAKKGLSRISRIILSNVIYQSIHAESSDIKGRIESVLYEKSVQSWAVLNEDYNLIAPRNPKVQSIFTEWDQILEKEGKIDIQKMFDVYQKVPYGINDYALSLLVAVYLASRREETKTQLNDTRIRLDEWTAQVFTDKTVSLKVMFDTTVVQVKPEESANKYLNLYKKVVQNTDINIAKKLYDEYNDLRVEEDIPTELEDKVTNMEMILKEGNKYYDQTLRVFGELKQKLSDQRTKTDDLGLVFDILDKTKEIQNYIGESDKYIYNFEQLEEARRIESAAEEYFEKTFPLFLKGLKCQSRSQATAFEKWVKRLIERLNNYGYKTEAQQLITKLEQVLDNLDPIQDKVNDYTSKNIPKPYYGYAKLMEIQEEGEKLIPQIGRSKLQPKEKDKCELEVNKIIEASKSALKLLNDEVGDIYDAIYDIQTLNQCQNFFQKVKSVLNKDINPMDREGIEEAANHLQNFLNDVQAIQAIQDNRFELEREFDVLSRRWNEIESEVEFIVILENYQQEVLEKLDLKEEDWLKQYLAEKEVISQWSTEECMNWLNKVKTAPNYLTEKSIERLSNTNNLVQERLKSLNVEAVISLFSNLTQEEKEIALAKMKELA